MLEVHLQSVISNRGKRQSWPGREAGSRLHGACTPIHTPQFQFNQTDSFFTIGSCFARNIEEYLLRCGVRTLSCDLQFPFEELQPNSRPNSLLTKYTAGSMLQEIEVSFGERPDATDERHIVTADEKAYYDINLPMWFPAVSQERAIERRGQVRELFKTIEKADVVVITLGLIEHSYDTETQLYTATVPNLRMIKRYPG